ncbi:hypothetical protein MP638_001348 [Amoeboaphelidium occidentale]|nr:hypothetical protein MP638_001348 [Amoeboaphelidium occidentale]
MFNLRFNRRLFWAGVATTSVALGSLTALSSFRSKKLQLEAHKTGAKGKVISLQELKSHTSKMDGIWVTYNGNVYDITSFINLHPGGDKIMLAAGSSLEPFWKVYTIHQKPEVFEILDKYKIGQLDEKSQKKLEEELVGQTGSDEFKSEPVDKRSPILVVRSRQPFNAETPLVLLSDEYITPNELFYKRNHLPVPVYDGKEDNYFLQISGVGMKQPVKLSLKELKQKFKQEKIVSTLQCAGNRRKDIEAAGPVQGLGWEGGAIGNAVWKGVLLKDVLNHFGVRNLNGAVQHVEFKGKDGYSASVPVDKVLSENGDVLLAFEMNGSDMLPDNGCPLRVVIPGHVAARSVKWVDEIVLRETECEGHWQQKDYKGFSPNAKWDKLDWSEAPSIQELPVQSAITYPKKDTVFKKGESVLVKGYAWSGGGRDIVRVDVSPDGGKTWQVADLVHTPKDYYAEHPDVKKTKSYGWTLWEANLDLPKDKSDINLVCKSVDSSYNVQPDTVQGIYNRRGVLSNAWHRVEVKVE